MAEIERAFDFDRDGVLNLSELTQMMRERDLRETLVSLFRISLDELKKNISNVKKSTQTLAAKLAAADANDDGQISDKELTHALNLAPVDILNETIMRIVIIAIGHGDAVYIDDVTTFFE